MTRKIWIIGLAAVALTAAVCASVVLSALFSARAAAVKGAEMQTEEAITVKEQEEVSLQATLCLAEKESAFFEELIVDTDPRMYTYDQMVRDLKQMEKNYPNLAKVDSIGETPDGRNVWRLVISSQSADRHVLVTASIHAREYITAQLVMKQASELLKQTVRDEQVLKNTAIHVIPMVNPDGVSISQLGLSGCQMEETRKRVQEIGAMDGAIDWDNYLRFWKSNSQGIDLNRNFDALWEEYHDGVGHPSADHYKGMAIGCAPEAEALIRLTESLPFERTISYHTQGEVIYWYFGQAGDLRAETERFARQVSQVTGYPMFADYEKLDPAGYKDWAIRKKGIPSLTIEVGRETSPVPPDQFPDIWRENKDVWNVMLDQ